MAMSKTQMATYIQGHLANVSYTPHEGVASDAAAGTNTREYLEAFCQGVIDEIINGAETRTTSGAPDGEHTGDVTA